MPYLITCIGGVVLSNGEAVDKENTGNLWTLKGVRCVTGFRLELLNPVRYLDEQFLVESPYLGDEADPELLIQSIMSALENNAPFTRLENVRYSSERYLKNIKQRFDLKRKTKVFLEKVKALEEEYKHLPPELVSMVKNFDHYYSYSDDISVYRRGSEDEKILSEKLAKAGALDFLRKYRALL